MDLVFLVGKSGFLDENIRIRNEWEEFGDLLVLGDFQESYGNLTLKSVHFLKFAKSVGSGARFFFKVRIRI